MGSQPGEATLNIRNNAKLPVTIQLDGRPVLEIQPNSSSSLQGLSPGTHRLLAVAGDQVLADIVAEIPARGSYVWDIGSVDATGAGNPLLRVRNYLGEKATVFVAGHSRITIDPGDSAVLTGVAPGQVELEAKSASGRSLLKATVEVVGGMERLWVMERPGGAVAVVEVKNESGKRLRIAIDGRSSRELEPRATTRYDDVAPGHHVLQAWLGDKLHDSLEAELLPNTPYEWVVEANP